uniref:Uncharacterized protein n=1 Tax=viral metagenome TaxID=1070528 RepID=A0A6H2A2R7_9ZZZZ
MTKPLPVVRVPPATRARLIALRDRLLAEGELSLTATGQCPHHLVVEYLLDREDASREVPSGDR